MPAPLSLASRVQANDDVLFQEVEHDAVLLNLKTGVYFGLDQVGTSVWQLLEKKEELARILEAILAQFDVTQEQCTQDLLALLGDMEKHGLVTIS